MDNLNKLKIPNADGDDVQIQDFSCSHKETRAIFRNVKQELITFINNSEVILGCIAWLTDSEILNSLSATDTCIVVQKEDFLRPETDYQNNWKETLHSHYSKLKFYFDRYSLPGIAANLSVCSDPSVDPIRCVGNHNSDKKSAFPRMHNKFLVRCKIGDFLDASEHHELIPTAIWTGSFNFSKTAGNSFENAIIIENETIANAYANEFAQIFALSEPLDWSSKWVEPELRIGT